MCMCYTYIHGHSCTHVHIQLSCLLHVPTHCMRITYKYFKIEFLESGENPCPPVDL